MYCTVQYSLDKAVREPETIKQMLSVNGPWLPIAFADDIDILAKSTIAVKEQFVKFKQDSEHVKNISYRFSFR